MRLFIQESWEERAVTAQEFQRRVEAIGDEQLRDCPLREFRAEIIGRMIAWEELNVSAPIRILLKASLPGTTLRV